MSMKTTFYFLLLFIVSCTKPGSSLLPCPYPVFKPSKHIANSNCLNPCQYVYEGILNFSENQLEVNCTTIPLNSESLTIQLDTNRVFNQHGYPLPIIRVLGDFNIGWCKRDFVLSNPACESDILDIHTIAYSDINELQIWLNRSSYDCYFFHDLEFRITSKNPLIL